MIFRNLDENDDWEFGKGIQSYISKNDAIKLNIKTRILSFKKNCFFDVEAGIDWFTRLGYSKQFDLLKNDIKNIILQTDDVVSVSDFNAILEDRIFTATCNIKTIYSPSVEVKITREF